LLMIGIPDHSISDNYIRFITDNNIGFVILFSRNIRTVPQVIELTGTLHRMGKVPPLVYTDQEGGTIVRFGEMAATVVSPMGIAATGILENAEASGRIIGEDMDICGIDGVFAPVLDVNIEEENPVIGIRSFGDQPQMVVDYGINFCKGLNNAGILACGKHYPGHGAAKADSHLEIPKIHLTNQGFMDYCYQPFYELAQTQIDSIMTAHVQYPEITPELATFSPYMIKELLRGKADYQGVVFTDCLEMKAVMNNFSTEDIVLKAIGAGVDILVASHTLGFQEELLDIILFYTRKGIIEENRIDESLARIFALKNKRYPGLTFTGNIQTQGNTDIKIRKNISQEREIARHSVTLLKNQLDVLPLERDKKVLILEWGRKITGPSVMENEKQTLIRKLSGQYFQNREHILLKPGEPLPPIVFSQIKNFQNIIVFIYSRTGKVDYMQTDAVKQLFKESKDIVLVSLENPYEIKKFPYIETFLVTYGFRKVQIEALMQILIGAISPTGKLPVQIGDLYSRGAGLSF